MDTAYAVPDQVGIGVRCECCDCEDATGLEDMDHVKDACGEAFRCYVQDETGEDVGEYPGIVCGGEFVDVDCASVDFR